MESIAKEKNTVSNKYDDKSSLQVISSLENESPPRSGGAGGSAYNDCGNSITSSLGGAAPSTIVSVGTINTGVSTVVRRGDGGRITRRRKKKSGGDLRTEDPFGIPGESLGSVFNNSLTEESGAVVDCCCCTWRRT
jgi:hypothetical protein